MARAITISVQLIDATLQGRRSLRLSKSTCNLGIVPRDMMKDTLANPKLNEQMLDKYSFYMLLSDNSSNSYGVYIGKARSFSTRVLDHLREKPNWHTALVFNSSVPGFLTDTEINYLEHLGIKLAKNLYPELTENQNVPAKPAISLEKEDEMDDFFEDIRLLTSFYGCSIFDEPIDGGAVHAHDDIPVLFFRQFLGQVNKQGHLPRGGFVIGRPIMTCCVQDIQFGGLVAKYPKSSELEHGGWVVMTAEIVREYNDMYEAIGPVFHVKEVVKCDPPEEEVATFY